MTLDEAKEAYENCETRRNLFNLFDTALTYYDDGVIGVDTLIGVLDTVWYWLEQDARKEDRANDTARG